MRQRGQAVVEFALAIAVFLVLLMAIVDFGMGIYKYNGVSEAAREVARVASVHQGTVTFGTSPEIASVQATQRKLVPGLVFAPLRCTDINGAAVTLVGGICPTTAFVTATVTSPYAPVTPLFGLLGTWNMSGTSSAQIQQ